MRTIRNNLQENQTHFRLEHLDQARKERLEIIYRESKCISDFNIYINSKEINQFWQKRKYSIDNVVELVEDHCQTKVNLNKTKGYLFNYIPRLT